MHPDQPDQETSDLHDTAPSKSQRKRDMLALQELGQILVELPPARLAAINLPEQLAEAVALARRIKARGGQRRQLQFIGKLMRDIDPEPIRNQLAEFAEGDTQARDRLHRLEALRDQLIAEGDAALQTVLEQYPRADRQHLRQLVRAARQPATGKTAPRAGRNLFRYLRELEESED